MKDHVALLLLDQNKFLFVKRSKSKKTLPGIWAFPSGTVEDGEEIYETAKREAKEELGVEIEVKNLLAVKELADFNVCLHFLVCVVLKGIPNIKALDEFEELSWLSFQQFFEKYSDSEIGHGLIFLRQHPEIWKDYS